MEELTDVLKPHDNMLYSVMEAEVYERALQRYRDMQMCLTGERIETRGHQYIESEFVVGSSDKMMFCAKELSSELTKSSKIALNPFIVAKLDIPSIKMFSFPPKV
jgi:hypothetical protein